MSYRSMLTAGKKNATKVNITSEVLASDGQGGYTKTWAVLHYDVLCRFNSLAASEAERIYDKLGVQADYAVYMEHVGGLKEGARLVKTDDSRDFAVRLVQDWDEDNSMLKVLVSEVGRLE